MATTVRSVRRSRFSAYVALTKPRIIELLLVTTVPTMIVAEGGMPSVALMVATVVGGTLAAGGANAINMYVDRDIDAIMERTKGRPLVTGEVTPKAALTFAIVIEVAAFVELWVLVNLLSAVLAVAACLFYVFIYTLWLKRTSTRNIVIGGAAGAAPVLIGWAAVRNELDWAPLVLFLIIFIWTPPHFWALAIRYREDYAAASVPMLPAVTSLRSTAVQILVYSVVLWGVTVLLAPVADLGAIYLVVALVTGAAFNGMGLALVRDPTPGRAMRLFGFSITYLTLLFAAMAVDVLVRSGLS
jgi:protoheme IX farnesyltransferase